MNYLNKVLDICSEKRGRLIILSFYYLVISSLDILGIALLGSFVTLILTPEYIDNILNKLNYLNINIDNENLIYFLGLSIIFVFILKTIVALVSYKKIINYSYSIQSNVREKIMKSCTNIDYETYTNLDTSKYIQMTGNMVKTFGSVLTALLQTFGDLIIFIIISAFLIYINYIFYLSILILSLIFFVIYKRVYLNQLFDIGEKDK